MKKIVAIVLGLVLLGAGALFIVGRGGQGNEYARYLPKDVVATLNLIHLDAMTDTFTSTALGRFLAKDTMHAVLTDLGGSARDLAEYDRMFDNVAGIMANPAFRAVFGQDATVALLSPDPAALQAKPLETLRDGLVVVARTTVAGALDLFSRMIKNANISREVVDELELTKVIIEPGQVLYGYAEGKMVFLAYSPAGIKRCLVAADKGDLKLEDLDIFKQAIAYWQASPQDKTYSRLFVNPQSLSHVLAAAPNPEFRQSAPLLQGIDTIYSMTYAGVQGVESRARFTYRYEQLHQVVKSSVDAATNPNPTLFLLQERSLAYNWASSLRPELITQALAENSLEYQQVDASLRGLLGVGIDDLGKTFGPQYGFVLDEIVRVALFAAPKMTFFVSLRDRALAGQVVDALRARIAESGMIKEEQDQVAGHTIYCWPLLPDKDAQPALAMTDTMLYLTTSKKALREILESTVVADRLPAPVATQLGGPLVERIVGANTGSLVIYPQRMSRQAGEALDWLAGILATTKNISISRLNQEMVRLMQSTEILAASSGMTREQADWSMTLRKALPQSEAAAVTETSR